MFKLTLRSLPVVLLICCLAACSSASRLKGDNPKTMFEEAIALREAGSYETAIKGFEQLQGTFPYGPYAQQAQLEIAYTYYKMQDGASAVAACDRFIKQYPTHVNVDYAWYLKGLTSLIEEDQFMAMIYSRDLSELDQAAARTAFEVFKTLVTRFPDSRYTPDARERMVRIADAIARSDLNIARYYYRRGAPVAAVGRAKEVLINHADTPQVEEALAIMMAGYDQLQLPALKADAERVLRQNYPQSAWLSKPYVAPR